MPTNPSETVTQELLPCPCCGSAPRRSIADQKGDNPPLYAIGCSRCIMMTEWTTEAEAIAAWNARPAPQITRGGGSNFYDRDGNLIRGERWIEVKGERWYQHPAAPDAPTDG